MIYIVSIIFGLVFGSFAGATVWRLRARQLVADKKLGEPVNKKELDTLQALTLNSLRNDHSMCLHCKHTLAWYDLIPLVSWLSTGGKCRYCKKSIGFFEPLMELGTALLFVLLTICVGQILPGASWPLIGILFVATVMLVILFAYDAKWFLLPDVISLPLIAVSFVFALLRIVGQSDVTSAAINTAGSVAIIGGLYFILYEYSKLRFGEEKTWVGFGDVKLGISLGLLLGSWQLAFLALFVANFVGVLLVLPMLVRKRMTMSTHVPFGPLLITGFFIALFFGSSIIACYSGLSFLFATLG